ncbi:hypothetical protein C8F01DRAFT_1284035 [Mycena amicta]|nr:hypothetical protein C8F01DRAFT_1284035 [Mycena amicta]
MSNPAQGKQRRTKAYMACVKCRNRKIKCDTTDYETPCKRCVRKKLECVYKAVGEDDDVGPSNSGGIQIPTMPPYFEPGPSTRTSGHGHGHGHRQQQPPYPGGPAPSQFPPAGGYQGYTPHPGPTYPNVTPPGYDQPMYGLPGAPPQQYPAQYPGPGPYGYPPSSASPWPMPSSSSSRPCSYCGLPLSHCQCAYR